MLINSIGCNSVYQNKNAYLPSYKGVLRNSGELQTAIKNGSDYGVHKLRTLMETIMKIDDGKFYRLKNQPINEPYQKHYYNLELQCLDSKNNILGTDVIVTTKEKLNKKDSVYKRVLTRVNAILEEHYVNPNNINRKQELETIDNLFPNKLN